MTLRIDRWIEGLNRGERRALGRLLTIVEDGDPGELRAIVAALHPRSGNARITGVTGSPGVGKSTLANALVAGLRTLDRSVGILAVDPSSPFSGGALLGDRVRMQRHIDDNRVFIRSMASRGQLGGLSVTTPQAVLAMDAAGFHDVLIETVGVGQSEVEIAAMADTTVVTLAPGIGDDVQAAKAGILEIADILVINKADQPGAGQLESQLREMLEMSDTTAEAHAGTDWLPPILQTVAVSGEGIPELLVAIDEHSRFLSESGLGKSRRERRDSHMIREIALASLRRRLLDLGPDSDSLLNSLAARVGSRELDPYQAADELLAALRAAD